MLFVRTALLIFPLALLILAGCASQPVVQSERYFWPPPPNPPRIEWLAAYHSQLDLEMSAFRRIKEALIGEDAPFTLKKPIEVRVDAVRDKIYVADLEAGGVFVFDLAGRELRMLRFAEAKISGVVQPIGLALDRESNLLVLDPQLKKIFVFDSSSEKFIRSIDLASLCQRPIAMALSKNEERIYVSDVILHQIIVLDSNGKFISAIGGPGDASGLLNRPVGLAVNSRDELLVADAFNARIQVFNARGVFLRAFGTRGDGIGGFQLIKGVAVDPDDNIYVVDGRSNDIKIFNPSGQLLLTFGNYYPVSTSGKLAPGGFALPVGIDIDDRGRIFVVDQLNARVQVFQYLSTAETH